MAVWGPESTWPEPTGMGQSVQPGNVASPALRSYQEPTVTPASTTLSIPP